MSDRTTGRMPRHYTQGVFKDKREIEKYRRIADRVMKQSKTYEKESKLTIVGLITVVILLSLTPLAILFKNKANKNKVGVMDKSPDEPNIDKNKFSNLI